MAAAYWIGVFAGIGAALGVLAAGLLADAVRGLAAAVLAAVVGVAVALVLRDWPEAAAAALGALLGALGTAQLVAGTLRRGGTRGGVAALLLGAAVVLAAVALIPVAGYVEALAAPVLGARLRRRSGETYAGLRTLARD